MRFKGLDLNLLLALDALLDKQSVSRAAEQLHLSQPAVSAALGRLRTFFGDPILVPHGKRMLPTAHALRLQPLLQELLADVDAMVAVSPHFEPATSTRRFRIATADFICLTIFGDLFPRLERSAPGLQFDIIAPHDDTQQMLEQGEIDLLITPSGHISADHPAELLFEERHVVVGWSGNPLMAAPITREVFAQAGHVAVRMGRLVRGSFAESHLKSLGLERRVEVLVSSFGIVPDLLLNTGRLAIMHERLARRAALHFPIVMAELPFEMPLMQEMIQYHRSRADDAGLRWIINQMREVAESQAV